MARQLTEAEIQQRRDAAKARWAFATGVTAAGFAGHAIPKAFLAPRDPTEGEVKAVYRQAGKNAMAALRQAGADKADRSRIWVKRRGATMDAIRQTYRPIGNSKVQAASAVGMALLAGGLMLPGVIRAKEITNAQIAADEEAHAERAGRALRWGGAVIGGLGALRAAMPVVQRRVPRAAIAAAGGGAALLAARKDR